MKTDFYPLKRSCVCPVEASQTHEDIFKYIPLPDLTSIPTELKLSFLEEASVDSMKQRIINNIDQMHSLGAISSQEKSILNSYIDDFCAGNSINYDTILAQITAVPDKPFDGAISRFLVTLGRQSYCWWEHYLVAEFPNQEPPIVEIALNDLLSGAVGWGWYVVSNWSHHYESDFGMNGLNFAGQAALFGSAGAVRF